MSTIINFLGGNDQMKVAPEVDICLKVGLVSTSKVEMSILLL